MKDYIQIGIEKGLILLNEDRLRITYVYQKKKRNVFLYMKCVRETAMLYFGGSAGQQRISSSYLENFDLPLPPKEKQLEIACLKPRPCRKKGNTCLKRPNREWRE